MNKTGSHNISNFNRFKEDELAHFEEQLRLIKKYKKNDPEEMKHDFLGLKDLNKTLQNRSYNIGKLKKNNLKGERFIETDQFKYNLYLKEREVIILESKSHDESFQTNNDESLYKEINNQDINSLQEMLGKCSKSESDIICEINKLQSRKDKMMQNIEKVDEEINNIKEVFKENKFENKENRLLNIYTEMRQKFRNEIFDLEKDLLQKKDKAAINLLNCMSIAKKLYDCQSKFIEEYQSDLEDFHIKKSNLKKRINDELTKIRSQFETGLQNLQKSYDEKISELESLQSKLVALEKSVQQEIKRQGLQKQLNKLASQVSTTRHEKETIAQKLEGHCKELEGCHKELEESHKALAAAEQEKMLLGTRLEDSRDKLEEKEKQLKHAEDEWEEKSMTAQRVRHLLETAQLERDQQVEALATAKHNIEALEYKLKEYRSGLKELTGDIQRLKDSFVNSRKKSKELGPFRKQIWRVKER